MEETPDELELDGAIENQVENEVGECETERRQKQLKLIVGLSGLAATAMFCAAQSCSEEEPKRLLPKYKRAAIPGRIPAISGTPWRRILTFGGVDDFIVSINFTKSHLQTYFSQHSCNIVMA